MKVAEGIATITFNRPEKLQRGARPDPRRTAGSAQPRRRGRCGAGRHHHRQRPCLCSGTDLTGANWGRAGQPVTGEAWRRTGGGRPAAHWDMPKNLVIGALNALAVASAASAVLHGHTPGRRGAPRLALSTPAAAIFCKKSCSSFLSAAPAVGIARAMGNGCPRAAFGMADEAEKLGLRAGRAAGGRNCSRAARAIGGAPGGIAGHTSPAPWPSAAN